MDFVFLLTYVVYCVAIIGVVFLFNWVHLKLETMRLKQRFIKDLIDKGYETENIDLNNFIK